MATATKTRSSSAAKRSSSSRSRSSSEESGKLDETDRYRRAAEDALQQLDWAIGYLHGIGKTQISRALSNNRSYIRRNLMDRSEQPLPTQQTNET